MKKTIFILLILSGITSFAQQLTCEDFKEGIFLAEILEPVKMKLKIIRKGNKQIEIVEEMPKEHKDLGHPIEPSYVNLEWIGDCSYISTLDNTKNETDEMKRRINSIGRIKTIMTKIEGNYIHFKSLIIANGEEISTVGKMYKEL